MGKFFVLKIEKIEVIMLLQLVVNRVTLLWFVGYSWGGGGGGCLFGQHTCTSKRTYIGLIPWPITNFGTLKPRNGPGTRLYYYRYTIKGL